MPLVGDPQRGRAVRLLQQAYADGYLDPSELEQRVERALRARTSVHLGASVRGLPGALADILLHGIAAPAVRAGTFGLRQRVSRALMRLAVGGWALATVILGAVAGIVALAETLTTGVVVGLSLVWGAASAVAFLVTRLARRLARP